jgi:hypothetical protein
MTKKILFISYFAGVDANCPAEWADDRLRSIESLGERVTVLTNYGSKLIGGLNTRIIRTPSLSSDDFSHELNLRGGSKAINGVGKYFLIALVCIVGDLLKWLTKLLTRGGSGGKWSWLICTIPVGIWVALFFRPHIIYCTGGPPSAYIIGLIISLVYRVPFKVEFQDPLVGKEIGKSKFKQKVVRIFERLILSRAELCVYVTSRAARDSQGRNQDLKNKIICNYPGSWNFSLSNHIDHESRQKNGIVNILHLGTLYGSRNLDKFFIALDELYSTGNIKRGNVMVTNLGSVYTSNVAEYLARDDFNLIPERQRIDALKIASSASYLLLVQHDDERSTETIPYKLYDYMNLNIPIILLVKNDEIKDLCPEYASLSASCGDISHIKSAIYHAVNLYKTIGYENLRDTNNIKLSINTQISNIIYRP